LHKGKVMKRDMESREGISLLVNKFYEKLLSDKTISYIFTDVAKIDLRDRLKLSLRLI